MSEKKKRKRIEREEDYKMVMIGYKNIPIIILHQPWCNWIAMGWKTIETRLHSRFKNLKGKRIGIHVGKKWDKYAFEAATEYLDSEKVLLSDLLITGDSGYIICTAFVSDFRLCTKDDSTDIKINNEAFGGPFYKGQQAI